MNPAALRACGIEKGTVVVVVVIQRSNPISSSNKRLIFRNFWPEKILFAPLGFLGLQRRTVFRFVQVFLESDERLTDNLGGTQICERVGDRIVVLKAE